MYLLVYFCYLPLAYIASAVPVADVGAEDDYPRYINFSDDEGNVHLVDLEEEPDMALLEEIQRNPSNNLYLLFTR
jgi:hypothetical protein